jgi:hypothetical protein
MIADTGWPSRCSNRRCKKARRGVRNVRGTFFRRVLWRLQEGEAIDVTGFAPWMNVEVARACAVLRDNGWMVCDDR